MVLSLKRCCWYWLHGTMWGLNEIIWVNCLVGIGNPVNASSILLLFHWMHTFFFFLIKQSSVMTDIPWYPAISDLWFYALPESCLNWLLPKHISPQWTCEMWRDELKLARGAGSVRLGVGIGASWAGRNNRRKGLVLSASWHITDTQRRTKHLTSSDQENRFEKVATSCSILIGLHSA